ncbi:MAG: LytR C-terminal domain-containing protein, partial [Kineosporiaceae bacterium]
PDDAAADSGLRTASDATPEPAAERAPEPEPDAEPVPDAEPEPEPEPEPEAEPAEAVVDEPRPWFETVPDRSPAPADPVAEEAVGEPVVDTEDADEDLGDAVVISHDDVVEAVDLGLVGQDPGPDPRPPDPPEAPVRLEPPAAAAAPAAQEPLEPPAPLGPPAPLEPPAPPEPTVPPEPLSAAGPEVATGAPPVAPVPPPTDKTYEPATTTITLRPDVALLAAHRRRERRRTLTFLGIFLGVLTMGLAAFTFFQGAWAWPFGDDTPAAQPCPAPTRTAVDAKGITLRVYNASNKNGLARSVSATLKKRGFTITEISNDPLEAKVPSAAVLRHGPAGLDTARTVAVHVEGKVAYVDDGRVSQSVDLVLGTKFTKLRTTAQVAKALTPAAPSGPPGCTPAPGPAGSSAPPPSGS